MPTSGRWRSTWSSFGGAAPDGRFAIRVEAASTGLRKPVNVIESNYKLMPRVCPWWDGVARGEAAE